MNAESTAMFTTALTIVICLAVAGTLYTLFSPLLEGDKLKKRMKSVSAERDSLRKARFQELDNPAALRPESRGFVKKIVDNLSLKKC